MPASGNSGTLIVADDLVIRGEVRNGVNVEIYGSIEGEVATKALVVHNGGKLIGIARAERADIGGMAEGELTVKNLISIRSTGTVNGNVRYGQLAMEHGGNLSAEVRNVPPTISGDFELIVDHGRAVRLTLDDLKAIDPDDKAENLVFRVSNVVRGFVMLTSGPPVVTETFTQADLAAGHVVFAHDGTPDPSASFDVVVVDKAGATSGAPRTVRVAVRPAR